MLKVEIIERLFNSGGKKNKMQYNKKAQSGLAIAIVAVLAVVVITGVIWGGFQLNKQTALKEEELMLAKEKASKPIEQKSEESKAGDIVVVQATANDLQDNNNAQISVPSFFYTRDEGTGAFKEYVGGTAGFTLSSSATTSIKPVTIGSYLCGTAFNSTGGASGTVGYYGKEKCKKIQTEGENFQLEVNRICRQNQLQGYLITNLNALGQNLTGGVSQSNSFARLEMRVNGTDCAYNLGGWYVDVIAGTNIQDVSMEDAVAKGATIVKLEETNVNFKRLSDTDNYVFEVENPILMKEYETVKSGSFTILADGDGCSTAEPVNVTAFDKSNFQSSKSGRPLLSGYEDDQTSPADIGSADILITSTGSGTSGTNSMNRDGSSSFYCVP